MENDTNKVQDTELYDIDSDAARRLEEVWINEIHKYPLLSAEEELKYGNDLKLINDSVIIDSKKHIQLPIVFSNLTDKVASEVLSGLKGMYADIHEESLSSEENLLYSYIKKYNELGRVLNEEELKKMGITKEKNIDEVTLLKQVGNYIKYNTAKYKLIHSNLGLILPIANKYHRIFKVDLMDLISEGNIGLMKAVESFDVDRKCRLSTHATWWIRNHVLKYASGNYTPFKAGITYWERARKFQLQIKELEEKNNRKYTFSEIAEIFNMDYNTVLDYMLYDSRATYLDQKVGDDEDSSIGDFIPGKETDFEEDIYKQELREALNEYIDFLNPGQQQVIRLLYGLNPENREYTVPEVCNMLKITKGAVEGRLKKGLKILFALVRRNGNKDKLQYFKTLF